MMNFHLSCALIVLALPPYGSALAAAPAVPSATAPKAQVISTQATSRGRPFTPDNCYLINLLDYGNFLVGAGDYDSQRNSFSGIVTGVDSSAGQVVMAAVLGMGAVSGLRNPMICSNDATCVRTYEQGGKSVILVKHLPVQLAISCTG